MASSGSGAGIVCDELETSCHTREQGSYKSLLESCLKDSDGHANKFHWPKMG